MEFDTILYEKANSIAYITLNRPDKLNAMSQEMANELRAAWTDFEQDAAVRVAVVTGKGRAFTAGADVSAAFRGEKLDLPVGMPDLGTEVTKPTICAVNGYCGGMGLVLAFLCDIRIASEAASFGYPEAKVGIAGLIGPELVNFMPMGIAMEMMFTGDPITAKRAYEIGFVNRVTPPDQLMPEATKLAQTIARNAPLVLKNLKKMAYLGTRSVHRQGTAIRLQMVQALSDSEDAKEGLRAFQEKREPKFQGK